MHILGRPSRLDVVLAVCELTANPTPHLAIEFLQQKVFQTPRWFVSVVVFPQPEGPNRHKIFPG